MTKNDDKKCHQCVEMLKQVLTSAASRPRELLEAMGSSCDFLPAENGVVVSFHDSIGSTTTAAPPHVSSNHEKQQQVSQVRSHSVPSDISSPQQPLLAASAAAALPAENLKIECRPCGTQGPEGGARAFVMGPSPLSIVLCSNRLHNSTDTHEMEQVLTHELIHVYDVKSLQMDLRKCVNLAYSEIRAAREAECHDSWMQSHCVKQKALQATSNLFPQQAGFCISQAYSQAMNDLRPFRDSTDNTSSSHHYSER